MKRNPKFRNLPEKTIIIFFSLLAVSGLISLVFLLATPSEPRNQVFLVYSIPRITAGVAVLLGSLYFSVLGVKAVRQRDWANRVWRRFFGRKISAVFLRAVLLGAFVGYIGTLLPAYRLGYLAGYLEQLRPVITWIGAASFLTLLLILVSRGRAGVISIFKSNEAIFRIWTICIIVGLLIWGLVAISGLGIRFQEDHWYGAGVPILAPQIIFALAIGILLWRYECNKSHPRKPFSLDLILFFTIWLVAGILWAREPLRPSFFMVGPTQPNNAYYPFSDSASFDTSSQYALIGQGIRNGEVFDRPGYIAWLTLLHVLIGQNFESLAALQAGIFGVLPAIIYLLGKEIHSRSLGVTAAAITAFRGINSIAASNLIDLASPKMLLTDFPTAIGMALFTLLVLHWLKRPAERPHNALAAGCALGLSILLRTNALLMLPGILIFALFSINRDAQVKTKHRLPKPNITRIRKSYWKEWLLGAMLVISGMLVTTLPWDLRNYSKGAPMFYLYFARIQSVIEQRYRQPLEEIPYEDPRNNYSDREIPGKKPMFTISPHPATDFRIETAAQLRTCSSLTCSISNHFLHNLVTSILIFPASLQLDDLFNTVKAGVPLWGPDWDGGGLGPVGFALIALNLAVLSLGVGGSWQRQRWLGLTPFTVYLAYTLSNALARTSGGRYLVPVDWVVVLYFNLGAILLVQWAVSLIDGTIAKSPRPRGVEHSVPTRSRTAQLPAMLFMIVLIGSLIPLSEIVFPRRYADDLASESMLALLHERQRQTLFQHIGIDPTVGIESFLQSNPEVRFLIGRALYPRFSRLDLPPLSFTLIGPSGTSGVVLPSDPMASFPHAGDVLVFGCQRAEYLEVFAVFVLDDADGSYLRSPSVPLEC